MKTDEQKAQEILKAFEPLKNIMKPKHTPLPWKYVPKTSLRYDTFNGNKSETTEHWIRSEDDNFICIMGTITPDQDAELIVRAVNCHDELVTALENLLHAIGETDTSNNSTLTTEYLGSFELAAEKAIKRARGEL